MNYFKKINWKLLNLSLWVELIIVYLMPFKKIDDFRFTVGFPIPFLTIYNTTPNVSPLHSMLFNPMLFFINGIIIYYSVVLIKILYKKIISLLSTSAN